MAARTGRFYGRAMTAGDIYTIARNGTYGFSGDGGPAKSAELTQPSVVAVDGLGNLVFADSSNERIRVVAASTGSFYGQATTAWIHHRRRRHRRVLRGRWPRDQRRILESQRRGGGPRRQRANRRLRQSPRPRGGREHRHVLRPGDYRSATSTPWPDRAPRFSGAARPATRAELYEPEAAAVDAAGNMVIADTFNSRVLVVAASTGTFYGRAMTAGDIYVVAYGTAGFAGDGGPATAAELYWPSGVDIDRAGNLLISDSSNERVRS